MPQKKLLTVSKRLSKYLIPALAAIACLSQPLQALAEQLSAQDIEYLAILNGALLRDKNYNLRGAVDNIPNEEKVKAAKDFCKLLDEGGTFNEFGNYLYANTDYPPDATAEEIGAFKAYLMTVGVVAIRHYCPQYKYQLEN
jgi:hypothetical protein